MYKLTATLLTLTFISFKSFAFPIAVSGTEGLEVRVGGTSDVIATYEGNSASFNNTLYLMLDANGNPADDGDFSNDLFVFNNKSSTPGDTLNLGSFAANTELMFRLFVSNTNYNYYTGSASRNPDGFAHARVQQNWKPNTTLVSFEDLFNGAFIYNDLSFSFTNTVSNATNVSAPSIISLMIAFAGAAFARRKFLS